MTKAAKQVVPFLSKAEQDELVTKNVRLAMHFAKKFVPPVDLGDYLHDAYSAGLIGLVEAAQRFDPNNGAAFSTFAAYWVKMRIRRYMADARHVVRPSHGSRDEQVSYRYHPTERALSQRFGRVPTSLEMMEALGCTREQYDAARFRFRRHDAAVCHVDGWESYHVPPSNDVGPDELVADARDRHVTTKAICEALSLLSRPEREVIRRRYLSDPGETLREIGDDWGRSRERIRQIEAEAMRKLRKVLKERREELMGVEE